MEQGSRRGSRARRGPGTWDTWGVVFFGGRACPCRAEMELQPLLPHPKGESAELAVASREGAWDCSGVGGVRKASLCHCSHTSHCCAVTGYLFTSLVRFPSSPEFSPSVPSLCSLSLLFFRATMKCASSLLLLLVSLVAPVPGLSPWGRVAPELGIRSWNN